jgi:mRNA interferase MazF
MDIKRGHIYRLNLNPTIGHEQQGSARPCVVLSNDVLNLHMSTILVVPLTSSARARLPIAVPVPSAGMPNSIALTLQMRAVDKRRIGAMSGGELSAVDLKALEEAVRAVADL